MLKEIICLSVQVMKDSCERTVSAKQSWKSSTDTPKTIASSACTEAGPSSHNLHKPSAWSGFLSSGFSIFNTYSDPRSTNKVFCSKTHGWTAALRRVISSGSMRRILGLNKPGISTSKSDIWLLGTCYKVSEDDSITDPSQSEGFASFVEDFSSRIWFTYRKGVFIADG